MYVFCLFCLNWKYLHFSFAGILAFFSKMYSWCIMILVNESEYVDGDYAHTFPLFLPISIFENILVAKDGHQYLNCCGCFYPYQNFGTLHLHHTWHVQWRKEHWVILKMRKNCHKSFQWILTPYMSKQCSLNNKTVVLQEAIDINLQNKSALWWWNDMA